MENGLLSTVEKSAKYWWISLIIGILAIGLGICCLFTPMDTFQALSIVFIISFIVGGILEITFALSNTKIMNNWGWTLAMGIIDVIFGIILICNPDLAPLFLAYLIAFWVLLRSIWGIGVSMDLQQIKNSQWGWLLALSILGVIISLILLFKPEITALFTAYIISFAFIFYGIFRIYYSIRLKDIGAQIKKFEQ